MDSQLPQTTILEAAMKSNHDQPPSKTEQFHSKQEKPPSPPPPPSSSSQTSSPSHEFSFTISSSTFPPIASSFAIDLSPADDIFFHGHLLPLRLLSHHPVSPRSSTDSFTLPVTESLDQRFKTIDYTDISTNLNEEKDKTKPKPPSCLLSMKNGHKEEDIEKPKRRLKLNNIISQVLKRYVKMVRPLLSLKEKKEKVGPERAQGYSYSENLIRVKKKEERRKRRGEYLSAPASMGASPNNSGPLFPEEGHFVHINTTTLPHHASDSTIEELQAAIQAAIAHCKNSINSSDSAK